MKPYYLINIIIIVLLFTYQYGRALDEAVGQSASNDSVTTSYESVFEQLMNLEIDPQQVAAVNNFLFQRDVGKFHLKEGELYFCKPIENRHYAAIFTGKGTFSFKPPTEIEQDQLNRFYETRKMEKDFNLLFIVFADSTYDQFRKQLTFEEGKISRKTKQQLDYCLKYLGKEKEKHFEYAILKTLLEQKYNKLFYAHFSKYKIQPMFFRINPFSEEEVQFMRRLKGPSYLYRPEVINQFHLQEEYQDSTYLTGEDKTSLHITDYKIDCALKGYKLDFSATTEIEFKSLTENQNWLTFWLFGELKVDSVFWDHGEKATFIKGNENPALWVKADHPLREGEQRKLTLHYHGDLLDRRKDWFFIRSSKGWYPQHGQRQRARFDITYHIPEEFQFASIGEKIFSKTEDGVITSRWKIDKPVRNISFNIGFFKEFKIESDSLPPITIYMAETGHLEIAHSLARLGVGSGKNMEKQVGEDVLNSIRFFRRKFGEPSADQFYATEIPYTHGEAFPGLIHLPWITFHRTTEGGYDATFRAHEVAHQWWGIGVDMKSYHDQWLSEGFAEYSGWWYFHQKLKAEEEEEDKFYEILKHWRENIINNRQYFLGEGQEAGPIWLGYRTYSTDTEGDYNLIIYKKGAWVLHMLRTLLLDLDTMNDDRFTELMRGFYQTYFDQKASSEDFIAYAEQSTGQNLDWFFDQWIYEVDVPLYKYAINVTPTEYNYHRVSLRVKQENVEDNFRMPVIIGLDFGNDIIIKKRVWVEGPVSEFNLGEYIFKPQKVIFNHLESVLCEVKQVDWE